MPQQAYYPPTDIPPGYRDRYGGAGGTPMEWPREREYVDYRREYDRRPPSSANS